MALAVVGTLVADNPRFHGPAFNRAAQLYQDELVQGLARAGLAPDAIFSVEPMAAFPRGSKFIGWPGPLTSRSGLAVRLLPFVNVHPFKALTAGVSALWALLGWARRNTGRPRVIHCVNLTMPPGVFLLLAARLTGSKASVSVLDVWKPGELVPDTWRWRFDFWMQRRLIPKFDGLMVVSRAIAHDLAPGRRVCLIEGGVPAGQFAPRVAAPREGRPFRVVLAGSLEPFNGVELVLDAFDRLPPGFELIVAGAGSLADRARDRASRNRAIRYEGFVGFEDVLRLYRSADLLLNARITRTIDTRYFFPSKLMELLASGTPVLSTCTGEVEEVYGDILYLLRVETPESLAAEVQRIAALPAESHDALGARAQAFMLEHKTWTQQAARLARYIRAEVVGPA